MTSALVSTRYGRRDRNGRFGVLPLVDRIARSGLEVMSLAVSVMTTASSSVRPRLAADLLGPDSSLGPMIAATILPLISANGDPERSLAAVDDAATSAHLRRGRCPPKTPCPGRGESALPGRFGRRDGSLVRASTVEDDGVRSTRLVHQTALLATGIT